MILRTPLLAAVLALTALAGCFGGDSTDPTDPDPDLSPSPSPGQPTATPRPPGSPPPTVGEPSDPTDPSAPIPPEWVWPSLTDATIRPGVQMVSEIGQCTSNFLFLDPLNSTVYLGFAAHCVAEGAANDTNGCSSAISPLPLGASVDVEGASKPATLVYSSWLTMQAGNETDGDACSYNDFAVVELHPDDHGKAHPAMLTFGGPTGYASSVSVGNKVLTFGNTGLRPGPSQLDAREGYVLFSSAWSTTIYTAGPGLPGDSGSGALTGDGEALGVLVTLGALPFPGSNGVTRLDAAVDYATQHGELDLRLATWDLLDGGLLP